MAALEEEKITAAVERDALIANYKQHLQIEKEQQENKKKVRYTSDMLLRMYQFPVRIHEF